jgi:tRNA threonylcarbamoyladenosine modification (KEOPS) complex Cgi121 subunit
MWLANENTEDAPNSCVRYASMRQIHAAIEHLHRGDFECAITLAAAAE